MNIKPYEELQAMIAEEYDGWVREIGYKINPYSDENKYGYEHLEAGNVRRGDLLEYTDAIFPTSYYHCSRSDVGIPVSKMGKRVFRIINKH
jgi:hypothetical protein